MPAFRHLRLPMNLLVPPTVFTSSLGPVPTGPPSFGEPLPTAPIGNDEGGDPGSKWEGILVAVAAVIGAVVMVGALVWWQQRDDVAEAGEEISAGAAGEESGGEGDETPEDGDGSGDGASGDEATEEPSEGANGEEGTSDEGDVSGAITPTPCPDGVAEEICDAAAFVEQFRGRNFDRFPTVELTDRDDFQERLLVDFDEDAEELRVFGEQLRSLGLIPSDTDLVDVFRRSLEVGVVGFYRTDTEELLIRGSDLDLYAELVIVHELTHAHDDQLFDLDRPEIDDADDESGYGFTAVVEGNASRVENAWRAQLSDEERGELSRLEQNLFTSEDIQILRSIPGIVLELQFSPYEDGETAVSAIERAAGGGVAGEAAVNEALMNPPRTSESILHPDQLIDGKEEVVIAVPRPSAPNGASVLDEGVIGELMFDLWLGDAVGDGWGGDRYVVWETAADRVCTAVHVSADTDQDLEEFVGAAEAWAAQESDDRPVAQTAVPGDDGPIKVVRIEGCI